MEGLRVFYGILLDLLFPPTGDEKRIAALSAADLMNGIRAESFGEPYLFAPLSYHDKTVRALIWTLKYRGRRASAKLLAEALADILIEELAEREAWRAFDKPLLIPMPLAKKRRRERGFNQSEMLGEELASRIPSLTYLPRALSKIKETPPQTKLLRKSERQKNLSGAFRADATLVKNRNIILLDDVITTGSSMKEARKALFDAGASAVWCVGVAH